MGGQGLFRLGQQGTGFLARTKESLVNKLGEPSKAGGMESKGWV